jgi:hypothetical protein
MGSDGCHVNLVKGGRLDPHRKLLHPPGWFAHPLTKVLSSGGDIRFASPMRPNPIASSIVAVEAIEDGAILVGGLDCLDGTPLLDVKPWRGEAVRFPATRAG